MSDLTGTSIDAYRILEKIGEGGFGAVYKALQVDLGREVAVKIIHREMIGDREAVTRFVREAQALSRLQHKNIVPFYSFGTFLDLQPYIVMAYFESTSLSSLIPPEGMPVDQVLGIALQACDALAHAHSHGFIHRDIKPSNCLLSVGGELKLVDFGLVRILQGSGLDLMRLTQAGLLVGTPLYASPEQCRGEATDERSDIYSLGCTIYHALFGVPPFQSEVQEGIMLQQVGRQASFTRRDASTIDHPLVDCIAIAMEKNADDRFASANEFGRALHDAVAQGKAGSRFSRQTIPAHSLNTAKLPLRAGSRGLLWISSIVIFLSLLAVSLVLLNHGVLSYRAGQPDALKLFGDAKLLEHEHRYKEALDQLIRAFNVCQNGSVMLKIVELEVNILTTKIDLDADTIDKGSYAPVIQRQISTIVTNTSIPKDNLSEALVAYVHVLFDSAIAIKLDLPLAEEQVRALGVASNCGDLARAGRSQIAILLSKTNRKLSERLELELLPALESKIDLASFQTLFTASMFERDLRELGHHSCSFSKSQDLMELALKRAESTLHLNVAMTEYGKLAIAALDNDAFRASIPGSQTDAKPVEHLSPPKSPSAGRIDVSKFEQSYEQYRPRLEELTRVIDATALSRQLLSEGSTEKARSYAYEVINTLCRYRHLNAAEKMLFDASLEVLPQKDRLEILSKR